MRPPIEKHRGGVPWFAIIVAGCLLVVLLGLLSPRHRNARMGPPAQAGSQWHAEGPIISTRTHPSPGHISSAQPVASADQIVASKLIQFARKRRATAHAMAERLGLQMPAEIDRFFDLAEAGRWDELKALFSSIKENRANGADAQELRALWGPVNETYGVEMVAHDWPAQQLLSYGQAILDSLSPGMVYVGGTDPGRFIPTLLNETGDADPHIILTQNALADNTYLDYVRFLYGDQMAALNAQDSQTAFEQYVADAQQRLLHDQQFPDQPAQIRPGEDIQMIDGRVQVSGQIAVMGINELLLTAFMNNNPGLSFALEESFPLRSTYADATPLGPIMQLGVLTDDQPALTSATADQAVSYWQSAAGQLLAQPDAGDSDSLVRMTYAKMADAQGNLLADHQFTAQAEQAYAIATQISPSLPEAVFSYVSLLTGQNRTADAIQVLQNAINAAPQNEQFLALLQQLKQRGSGN